MSGDGTSGLAAPRYGQPTARTNGFAIASLIFGIVGGILLSVIFGLVALSQIKRDGSAGRGMAIAGLVLSAGWTSLIVLGIVLAVATGASRGGSGQITGPGDVSTHALKVGDCVATLDQGTTTRPLTVPAVPCASPHAGEVVAVFNLAVGPFPGREAVLQQAAARCNTELDAYAPGIPRTDPSVGLYLFFPQEASWSEGDRGVVCMARSTSGPTTGSVHGR